jgi:hypothetical protein
MRSLSFSILFWQSAGESDPYGGGEVPVDRAPGTGELVAHSGEPARCVLGGLRVLRCVLCNGFLESGRCSGRGPHLLNDGVFQVALGSRSAKVRMGESSSGMPARPPCEGTQLIEHPALLGLACLPQRLITSWVTALRFAIGSSTATPPPDPGGTGSSVKPSRTSSCEATTPFSRPFLVMQVAPLDTPAILVLLGRVPVSHGGCAFAREDERRETRWWRYFRLRTRTTRPQRPTSPHVAPAHAVGRQDKQRW